MPSLAITSCGVLRGRQASFLLDFHRQLNDSGCFRTILHRGGRKAGASFRPVFLCNRGVHWKHRHLAAQTCSGRLGEPRWNLGDCRRKCSGFLCRQCPCDPWRRGGNRPHSGSRIPNPFFLTGVRCCLPPVLTPDPGQKDLPVGRAADFGLLCPFHQQGGCLLHLKSPSDCWD